MLPTVIVLILLSQSPSHAVTLHEGCMPNTQFFVNGLSCACDSFGQWQDSDCRAIQRGQACLPGDTIQIGCSICVCQINNSIACDYKQCNQDTADANARRGLYAIGTRCTPFKSYYVNCSVCVCSASGRTADAQCVKDTSCSLNTSPDIKSGKRNICLPKVLYLFPCLHCICSDAGFFDTKKCVDVCEKDPLNLGSKCKPNTLFKKNCNICLCPYNGMKNDALCSSSTCHDAAKTGNLKTLQRKDESCLSNSFTIKKCIYCECTSDGKIDEDLCIEADCTNNTTDYDVSKLTCSTGEMVPFCTECFCLGNKTKNEKYCSKSCSYHSKLTILEKVLEDATEDKLLINKDAIETATIWCHPNKVVLKDNMYCLCDESGVVKEKLCRNQNGRVNLQAGMHNSQFHKFSITCKPSTFVEFDCNTCFCSKNGTIDAKWCTYDNCDSKKEIQESHKTMTRSFIESLNTTCIPGTISKDECNFCICSESGLTKERACTKNHCEDVEPVTSTFDKFICEPLSYYEVDCNICYCPRDGLKNISNCTKNNCEKNFLRSNVCLPGQLFSDNCNVCVCPPNGDKNDKACTNNSCPATLLKRNLAVGNQLVDSFRKRSLDHCFPGEEFFKGCRLCMCPDMGLKSYSTCNMMLCEEEGEFKNFDVSHSRRENINDGNRTYFNLPDVSTATPPCPSGGTYIDHNNCKECLCPVEGSEVPFSSYCRSLPPESDCKLHSNETLSSTAEDKRFTHVDVETTTRPEDAKVVIRRGQKTHPCQKPGKVMDECYVCYCDEKKHVIIQEHCFKNEAVKCEKAPATFLVAKSKNLKV